MRVLIASFQDLPPTEVDDQPFIAALEAAGHDVVVAPWDAAGLDPAVFDVCVLRTTWDYQERLAEFLQWARRMAESTRLLNPLPVVEWNTHKSYLRELEAAGIPTLPTEWLDCGGTADVRTLMERHRWSRGFIKPAIGSTARETLPFMADDEGLAAAQAHVDRLQPGEDLMLQAYCADVEAEGEWSVFFISGTATHAVRKIPVAGDYRVQDDFGATDERIPLDPVLVRHGQAAMSFAAQRCGIDGPLLYGRADFLREPAGEFCLIELELVEPSLFFRHDPSAAERMAAALPDYVNPSE